MRIQYVSINKGKKKQIKPMGNSLIHFQNKSLWIHDVYLEPIIFFVVKALSNRIERNEIASEHIEWFITYKVELQNLFIGASDGALDFEFDELRKNNYRMSIVKNILMTLFSQLNSININLRKEQFDKIGTFDFGNYANWEEPLNSKILAKKIDEILNFIS